MLEMSNKLRSKKCSSTLTIRKSLKFYLKGKSCKVWGGVPLSSLGFAFDLDEALCEHVSEGVLVLGVGLREEKVWLWLSIVGSE